MSLSMTKAERVREMERLYYQRAYSDIEMAQRFGVDRTTIFRDRTGLEAEAPIVQDEDGRYRIDRNKYLSSIRVNLTEALSLYLAARRASQQTRYAQRDTASALEKLALTLRQPMTEQLVKAASGILLQQVRPEREAVLATIAEAWVQGFCLRITYRGLQARRTFQHTVRPYLLEPSPWSDSVYLIGHSDRMAKVAIFKLDRIERAVMTGEQFTFPSDFDEQQMLRYAWGIWGGDEEPVTVKLRFAPGIATRRVRESVWHPLEKVTATDDGGCVWEAPIAEWREMLPWVRGWGADVEVMAPEKLRDEVKAHTATQAIVYGIASQSSGVEPYHLLWAKADRKTNALHRLVYHMIDVGLAAKALWEYSLHSQLKQNLADWLNLTVEETGRLVSFLASLHDLGKASPAFQDHSRMPGQLKTRVLAELRQVGFNFRDDRPQMENRTRHEIISTWSLRSGQGEQLLHVVSGLPVYLCDQFSQALGGHHGVWPQPRVFNPASFTTADKGGSEWTAARSGLVLAMKQIFEPPIVSTFEPEPGEDNVRLTLFSAIVAVADWIGSQEGRFPLEDQILPLESYVRHARCHVQAAMQDVQWKTPTDMPNLDFARVFGFEPNPFQIKILESLNHVSLPAFAIVEGPMGVGKTEVAFSIYSEWGKRSGAAGVYIAMPTTATSNQMHDRAKRFLSRQLGREIEPLLVHSQALLRDAPDQSDPVEESEHEGDSASNQTWFLPRKKSLLAPYGVGTVDQALMSILQTKHFFVRLLGLSHKVVIFDEVHAYDAYMSELFERLLSWLRAVDASVIVLSATLPDKTRQKLVQAYAGKGHITTESAVYPRLTFVDGDCNSSSVVALPSPPAKTLHYRWLPRDEEAIIETLAALLAEGGCAAVICNTVTRAQTLFQVIRDRVDKICDDDDLILFHARFPMAWREEIEQKVLRKFGAGSDKSKRNPERPRRAIVIATQVIEQSLDLDFDIMISDHAPIDLLLQRSGRLHRHGVNDPARRHPNCLWIAEPPIEDDVPLFDRSDKHVYDEYALLRSWLTLKAIDDQTILMPDSLTTLIESVYGDRQPPASDAQTKALDAALSEMENDQFGERVRARKRRITKPTDEDLLWRDNLALEEDDPTVHETFQAMTRSDRPGLSVICLHQVMGQLYFDPTDPTSVYDLQTPETPQLVRALARQSVTIRRPDVEKHLLAEPDDEDAKMILARWRRISALRYHRVAIFEQSVCLLPGAPFVLRLDKSNQLGLQISKEMQ